MSYKQNILLILLNAVFVSCGDFKSRPTTIKTHENDTVLLPCYLHKTGSEETGGEPERIRWFKDQHLLADSKEPALLLNEDKLKLHANGSLEVFNVQDFDTGDYMCEVLRKPPWSSIKQLHAIEVQYPPQVRAYPESGFLEVQLGHVVTISCNATGVPAPLITWWRQGEEISSLDNRDTLTFTATDRQFSGEYECSASNGVGEPSRAKIQVNIIYPPEVSSAVSWLHASAGLRATLECRVLADPPAEVKWYKSNISVPLDSRVLTLVNGEIHTLLIKKVLISDFGIYTCRATNELGTGEAEIQLSGVANPGVFKSIEQDPERQSDSYTLIWEVDSYTPIIEYNLWFRPFRMYNIIKTPDWTKLTVPAEHTTGPIHSKAYELAGLQRNTVYEAMLFSKNRYGWSKPSKILRFSIDGTAMKEEVVTQMQIQENVIPVDLIPEPIVSNSINNAIKFETYSVLLPLCFLFNFITTFSINK